MSTISRQPIYNYKNAHHSCLNVIIKLLVVIKLISTCGSFFGIMPVEYAGAFSVISILYFMVCCYDVLTKALFLLLFISIIVEILLWPICVLMLLFVKRTGLFALIVIMLLSVIDAIVFVLTGMDWPVKILGMIFNVCIIVLILVTIKNGCHKSGKDG